MSRILVTGVRAPVAVDLVRALTAQGHEVHMADVFRSAIAARLPATSYGFYASPVHAPETFRDDAQRVSEKADLIICLCEEIFHFAPLGLPLFAPSVDQLRALHSKYRFAEMARALGLCVPDTEIVSGSCDTFDTVLKPEFSRFGTRTLVHPNAATVARLSHDPANPWLRQAYIHGTDISFYAIAYEGRMTAFTAWRSDWRTRGGASYYFDPLDPGHAAAIEAIALILCESLSLTGQISCDLREDADGRLWLLECNPRATSGLHLLAHDPARLAGAFMGHEGMVRDNGQAAYVGPAMWAYGGAEAIRTGRLAEWRRDRQLGRDVLAGLGAAAARDSVRYSVSAARKGQDLAVFLTADIEYNGDGA